MKTAQELNNFIDAVHNLQVAIHDNALKKGFWESDNDGEKIALMHTELSEALESLRRGDPPDDKIPEFKGSEAELADCVIRILDFAQRRNLDVAAAIVAKIAYNSTRPYKHGKLY